MMWVRVSRTDIAQSQSRLAASEAGLAQAEAQLQISRATYKRIVGRMPVDLQPVPDFALPNDLPTAIALARDNNPQLLASYFNEEAGRAAIDVAKSNGRPTISLNGTLSAQRGQLLGIEETDQASLTAQISVPIFSGGLNRSRVRQAKHAKTRLAFETRDTELAVDQTVTQIWAQLEAAKRVFITSQQQLDAAEVAFEGVELELTVGTRTQLDVLNAEQEVLNAKLALINAERDVDSVTYQLLSILGVFDADGIALPVETYDAVQNFEAVRYRGFDRNIDRFVPEAAQKIGRQIPDIVNDVAGGVATLGRATKLDTVPETLSKAEVKPVKLLKDAADTVTGQEGEYHALRDVPLPEIVTEPIQPPSQPPRELIIDP
ncbi:TolC family protein [Litorimonas sp. RW-G-Af-16]|uniref:TolC family protein n=1 Tax=Litorimonas sp. RW-G-Af-16 TaxID=3241168 RepID=UPI003AAF0BC2